MQRFVFQSGYPTLPAALVMILLKTDNAITELNGLRLAV